MLVTLRFNQRQNPVKVLYLLIPTYNMLYLQSKKNGFSSHLGRAALLCYVDIVNKNI